MYLYRRCEFCKEIGPVGTRKNDLSGDRTVCRNTNPFAEDVYDDHTKYWICGGCHYDLFTKI
jgi:hypothetical protein